MKKFLQLVTSIKTMAVFAFTGAVMLVTVAAMFYGQTSIPVAWIWQLIFLASIYGILQFIIFSDHLFTQMKSAVRLVVLGISMFLVLSVFALIFSWFQFRDPFNWLIFLGVYLFIFTAAFVALKIVFQAGGMEYDELLVAYKARQHQ